MLLLQITVKRKITDHLTHKAGSLDERYFRSWHSEVLMNTNIPSVFRKKWSRSPKVPQWNTDTYTNAYTEVQ